MATQSKQSVPVGPNNKPPVEALIPTPPADPIPQDEWSGDAERAARATGGVPLSVLQQILSTRGSTCEHKGGAIPTLQFDRPGCVHVVRFLGQSKPGGVKDAEFDLLDFEVLDPESFDPKRDPKGAQARVLFRANLVKSWATEDYYDKAPKGDVAAISYHGEQPTKRNQAPLKLYTIHGFRTI